MFSENRKGWQYKLGTKALKHLPKKIFLNNHSNPIIWKKKKIGVCDVMWKIQTTILFKMLSFIILIWSNETVTLFVHKKNVIYLFL